MLAIADRQEFGRTLEEIETVTGKSAAEHGIRVSDWYRKAFGL